MCTRTQWLGGGGGASSSQHSTTPWSRVTPRAAASDPPTSDGDGTPPPPPPPPAKKTGESDDDERCVHAHVRTMSLSRGSVNVVLLVAPAEATMMQGVCATSRIPPPTHCVNIPSACLLTPADATFGFISRRVVSKDTVGCTGMVVSTERACSVAYGITMHLLALMAACTSKL